MKGTSRDQDSRFANPDKKLLKNLKYDSVLNEQVDMEKVMLDTLKTWIGARLSQMLGFEDEVVIDYVVEMLEKDRFPNPQEIQLNITGFLDAQKGRIFMRELWYLLKSAELNGGIPKEIVEMRMSELEEAQKRGQKIEEIMNTYEQTTDQPTSRESNLKNTSDNDLDSKERESYVNRHRRNKNRSFSRDKIDDKIEIIDKIDIKTKDKKYFEKSRRNTRISTRSRSKSRQRRNRGDSSERIKYSRYRRKNSDNKYSKNSIKENKNDNISDEYSKDYKSKRSKTKHGEKKYQKMSQSPSKDIYESKKSPINRNNHEESFYLDKDKSESRIDYPKKYKYSKSETSNHDSKRDRDKHLSVKSRKEKIPSDENIDSNVKIPVKSTNTEKVSKIDDKKTLNKDYSKLSKSKIIDDNRWNYKSKRHNRKRYLSPDHRRSRRSVSTPDTPKRYKNKKSQKNYYRRKHSPSPGSTETSSISSFTSSSTVGRSCSPNLKELRKEALKSMRKH